MRIVFMGSPEEVISPLKTLISKSFEVVAVISQPAKEQGRGRESIDPPLAAWAKAQNLNVLQPEKASDPVFLAKLRLLRPDVIITAAYGQILSDDFLAIPSRATINIHPSMLPKYRGATPVPAALLSGDTETGVTVLFTVKKMDAGAIIVQNAVPILPGETAPSLTKRLFEFSESLLLEALALLKNPNFVGLPQDETQVIHCKKIQKTDGVLDWSANAVEIENRFRAYFSWPGTAVSIEGQRILIMSLKVSRSTLKQSPGEFVYEKGVNALLVGTGNGTIEVSQLKPAGKNNLDAPSFYNGCKAKGVFHFDVPTFFK
jgi:methionyl-tRNA formyltransferase